MQSATEVTVKIKPVFEQLIHSGPYEGPCRVGKRGDLTTEADEERGEAAAKEFFNDLEENLNEEVEILEPAFLKWKDDFVLREEELKKLEPDVRNADLVLIEGGLDQYPAVAIAERYDKPIGTLGWVTSVDITASLRSKGMEGYAFLDYEDLNKFITLLRTRKAFQNTKMMVCLEGDSFPSSGVVSSISDLERLKKLYGVSHKFVSTHHFLEEMDQLSPADKKEVEELTDALIKGAEASHMDREDILPSVEFFVATRNLLDQYECNAFTIPCFEICARQVMEERKVMFCLTHSLLKDRGIPSACEADTNVLMAISLLTYLTDQSIYMGNSRGTDLQSNTLTVSHDVPGLKMQGLEEPDLPYEIRNFTVGGWGVTLRYDFSQDVGEPVTLARFNPDGDKLLVAKGEITGGQGFHEIGCSLGVDIELNDIADFFEKQQYFGHHMAIAYGNYVDLIHKVGKLMGFEVIES